MYIYIILHASILVMTHVPTGVVLLEAPKRIEGITQRKAAIVVVVVLKRTKLWWLGRGGGHGRRDGRGNKGRRSVQSERTTLSFFALDTTSIDVNVLGTQSLLKLMQCFSVARQQAVHVLVPVLLLLFYILLRAPLFVPLLISFSFLVPPHIHPKLELFRPLPKLPLVPRRVVHVVDQNRAPAPRHFWKIGRRIIGCCCCRLRLLLCLGRRCCHHLASRWVLSQVVVPIVEASRTTRFERENSVVEERSDGGEG